MNQFDFYKEFYFKELDSRSDINNSLSLPIGLITALVAGNFYLLTNFDYKYSLLFTLFFTIIIMSGLFFLSASVYQLIKSYSDFPRGYKYLILADTNDLENYNQKLKDFHAQNPDSEGTSYQEFEDYILGELIKNTDANQKNNKRKYNFRYNCEKYLITAFVAIYISLPFFAINYAFKDKKKDSTDIKIVSPEKIPCDLNSKENRNFILEILKDSNIMVKDISTRPAPPPSQIIKEGKHLNP